jgi:arylsulfatase
MAQPNMLMIVSDEERRNDWLGGKVSLPAHQRLAADGLSFDRHYTHASPCSPSRASLYTGRYLAEHGVVNNVSFPTHVALDPEIPTTGSLLRDVGYECGYVGKWHLSHSPTPEMMEYGYSGWTGNDKHFTGNPWTGRHFDPIIAADAQRWLAQHARSGTPWFLTVALVNPHDIMWFPIDQPDYQDAHPEQLEIFRFIQQYILGDEVRPDAAPTDYPRIFDELPANFHDDLHTKPEIQRAWRYVRNHEHMVGTLDHDDHDSWLRQLDYYAWLHQRLDDTLTGLLGTLDDLGVYDDTTVIYTSDHGDACGSHGLRAKLPCVYEEVMGVPLIVKGPGVEAGRTTDALSTHVDLAHTVVSMGGGDTSALSGVSLEPALADPEARPRDAVFFAQDSAQSPHLAGTRYAVRGFFDGETKYARYYGVGGGIRRDGTVDEAGKTFDVDADFDDQDHEWYETADDPHELNNLANDRGRRNELRSLFDRLKSMEATELSTN